MITRIIHLSDLHFPSRDRNVASILLQTIREKQPDFIVVTGDIANQPSAAALVGRGPWAAACGWLESVFADAPKKPRVLVLPGNHDVLFFGLTGFSWLPRKLFEYAFRQHLHADVLYVPSSRLTFLTLDTNPLTAVFSAEGKALARRISRLQRRMQDHENAADIRASTKILLIHHHPLPVPFEGDFLLATRRVDRLLRFMAEEKIDLVLHGHKHRGSWSHMRVGGTSDEPYFLETLGAGSAMKRNDHDRRGHNFNLIDIAGNGVRQIRQFFKLDGESGFREARHSPAEEAVTRLAQYQFRQPYRADRLTWRVEVDPNGDGLNTIVFDNLVFNHDRSTYEVPLLEDVGEASSLPYDRLQVSPSTLDGSLVRRTVDGRQAASIQFGRRPTRQMPAQVQVEHQSFNSYAMDQQQAMALGRTDTHRDCIDLNLSDPVDELCLEARFPEGFVFTNPRMDVYEPFDSTDTPNQFWTRELSAGSPPIVEANRLKLRLNQPPPNFRYRVSWDLPQAPDPGAAAVDRQMLFERAALDLLAPDPTPASLEFEEAIINAFQDLAAALERMVTNAVGAARPLNLFAGHPDLSLMVAQMEAGGVRCLRFAYWSLESEYSEQFLNARLPIGEGNAGRAYKARTVRLYNRAQAREDPRTNFFKDIPGMPSYQMVLSIPVLDSRSSLPLAVLNVATVVEQEAQLVRALPSEDLPELVKKVYDVHRDKLLNAAGLQV